MIADWFLSREAGASIVHNLICSRAVPEIVIAMVLIGIAVVLLLSVVMLVGAVPAGAVTPGLGQAEDGLRMALDSMRQLATDTRNNKQQKKTTRPKKGLPVKLGKDGRLTVLLAGSDWRKESGGERLDVVMVAAIEGRITTHPSLARHVGLGVVVVAGEELPVFFAAGDGVVFFPVARVGDRAALVDGVIDQALDFGEVQTIDWNTENLC